MAESLLLPVVRGVLGKATDALVQKVTRMWGVDDDRRDLELKLLYVQSLLADAEVKAEADNEAGRAVKAWMKELRGAAYQADDVLDDFQYEALRREALSLRSTTSKNRLWTAARLQLRQWKNNYFCALCERNLETAHHLFFECPYSQQVWQLVASWSSFPSLSPASWDNKTELVECFHRLLGAGGRKEHSMAILTLWSIWNRRNAVVFRDDRKVVQSLFVEIKDTAALWSRAGCNALIPLTVVNTRSE
ncbi:uncharacterized protein [Miscanthus floridulus]|uniref:uncharacterized protein isoform X1 n=1 Tax=Miscanthus floridulus TaxID=154761 RepID=UPI003458C428